jgi:hypothetical protein
MDDGRSGYHAENSRAICTISSKEHSLIIMPEILSKSWYISLEVACDTLHITTQVGV